VNCRIQETENLTSTSQCGSDELIIPARLEKPILRWAGGKSWLVKELDRFLPKTFNDYHEPFLGGGSIFFNLRPRNKSFLSDVNPDLINAHSQIRNNPDGILQVLQSFRNTVDDYYQIREANFSSPIEKAARFIFLNRTCFNGLYRVNREGQFNVPYGFKSYKQLFDRARFRRLSELLKHARLWCGDFEESLSNIREGDLVFLDPPYTVSHVKNGFIKYNERLFSWGDQKRLVSFIEKIRSRRAHYILTNAKHESIRDLFGRKEMPITVYRNNVIGGRGAARGTIEEYLFTNVNQEESL
jgi:DNA adenine methylase